MQLMIFTGSLVLLLILSKRGHNNLMPDPGDEVHFNVIFPLNENSEDGQRK